MKIKIIYDNRKDDERLQEGWGFSCLVEAGDRKILFDTGADKEAFFSNARKLGIQLDAITDVVYSHKHADHIAGFQEVLAKLNPSVRLFLPKGFHPPKLPVKPIIVKDFKEIGSQIYSFVMKGGLFFYEQVLVLSTDKGLVVITGCAHPGIVELLEAIKKKLKEPIRLALGGFHLFRKNQNAVDETVARFQALGVESAAPCHCSGDGAIAQFHEAYQDRFYKIGTGTVLHLN